MKSINGKRYIVAHPDSELGEPNEAKKRGFVFVAFLPNKGDGLFLYRRQTWLEKAITALTGI